LTERVNASACDRALCQGQEEKRASCCVCPTACPWLPALLTHARKLMPLYLLWGRDFALHLSFFCVNGIAIFTFNAYFYNQKSTSGLFRRTWFCFAVAEKKNIATASLLNLRSSHSEIVLFSSVYIQSI